MIVLTFVSHIHHGIDHVIKYIFFKQGKIFYRLGYFDRKDLVRKTKKKILKAGVAYLTASKSNIV